MGLLGKKGNPLFPEPIENTPFPERKLPFFSTKLEMILFFKKRQVFSKQSLVAAPSKKPRKKIMNRLVKKLRRIDVYRVTPIEDQYLEIWNGLFSKWKERGEQLVKPAGNQ